MATAKKFTKQQILNSKKYANQYDIVNAVLEDGRKYTLTQVDELIMQFRKGEVK